ncbi:MAG: RNA polymerase sigma factor region1.1 domain-containing protein, partial [Chloroflexota bacterium]
MMDRYGIEEQFEDIDWLLDEAEEEGYLTLDQIKEAFPQAEQDLSDLEDFFTFLHQEGIQVVDSESDVLAATEDEEAVPTDVDATEAADLSEISVDNAISLYFKEMGREPLLTREEEVE